MKRDLVSDGYGKALTHDRLVRVLRYEPEVGVFFWSESGRGRFKRAGAAAGRINQGRLHICIDGHEHAASRLAWFYVTGKWPEHEIDHIDGDAMNNRFENLRDVTRSVNGQNLRRPRSDNSTGKLGVSMQNGRPIATIQVNGRQRYLGRFATVDDAHAAYVDAKRELHEGCTL